MSWPNERLVWRERSRMDILRLVENPNDWRIGGRIIPKILNRTQIEDRLRFFGFNEVVVGELLKKMRLGEGQSL